MTTIHCFEVTKTSMRREFFVDISHGTTIGRVPVILTLKYPIAFCTSVITCTEQKMIENKKVLGKNYRKNIDTPTIAGARKIVVN